MNANKVMKIKEQWRRSCVSRAPG